MFYIAKYFERAESPLVRSGREKVMAMQEDSTGKCGEGFSKGSLSFQSQKEGPSDGSRGSVSQDGGEYLQDEVVRRREMALRQHAFFQLRLHIRRGANLVAMDRCGKIAAVLTFLSLLHFVYIFCLSLWTRIRISFISVSFISEANSLSVKLAFCHPRSI